MPITRRNLLGAMSGSTFFLTVSRAAISDVTPPASARAVAFPQGLASGDPQADGIMLWTRAVPADGTGASVPLLLQLAADSNFSKILLQAEVHTSSASDYTLRTYIDGLAPDTHYYYRFVGGGDSVSRTGRTRTAPSPDQARRVNLAFASCQSYEQAHFGSWARMLQEDRSAPENERIQFVLHLGDFIYERCWHQRMDGSEQARAVPPFPDGVDTAEYRYAVSLADYRHLYQTYLSDPHLQEARARWPFICTWDDHEYSNDNFQGFSTYGGGQQLEAQRKLNANQAWFEYIPAVLDQLEEQPAHDFRPQQLRGDDSAQNHEAIQSLRIYRKLNWGKHLDILLTDSRSYRSPPCVEEGLAASMGLPMDPVELVQMLDAGSTYNDGKPPATLPYGDGTVANPARDRAPGSMLGLEQRDWFLAAARDSSAPWKLWANALPLIPMRLDMSSLPFTGYQDSVFNLDAWAGFPHEVSYLMSYLQEQDITGVISLSGDHHMHGAGTISRSASDISAAPVAVDFTVAGISSTPLFEDLVEVARRDHPDFGTLVARDSAEGVEPVWNMSLLQGVLAAYTYNKTGLRVLSDLLGPNKANPGLRYVDTTANGYGLASFDAGQLRVQMFTLEDCRADFEQPPEIRHIANFQVARWAPGEQPQLQGPEFDGGAPFPFKAPKV